MRRERARASKSVCVCVKETDRQTEREREMEGRRDREMRFGGRERYSARECMHGMQKEGQKRQREVGREGEER